jgi:hypothetical protein
VLARPPFHAPCVQFNSSTTLFNIFVIRLNGGSALTNERELVE